MIVRQSNGRKGLIQPLAAGVMKVRSVLWIGVTAARSEGPVSDHRADDAPGPNLPFNPIAVQPVKPAIRCTREI